LEFFFDITRNNRKILKIKINALKLHKFEENFPKMGTVAKIYKTKN
jgi:hypothetical protein